jgi:hypothetical protein
MPFEGGLAADPGSIQSRPVILNRVPKRRVVVGALVLAAFVAVAWRRHGTDAHRAADVRAAEAVLDRFPPPAGAAHVDRSVETLRSEQGHVFGHNLRLSYRLPSDTVPQKILDAYAAAVPNGWHRADGRDCLALTQTPPPAPSPGDTVPPPPTALVVSAPRTQRFYTNGRDTAWLRLAREPAGTVRLDISNRRGPPNCTSQPDGGPDPEADAFR